MDSSRAAADEARARLDRAIRSVELTKNSLSYATLNADARGVVTATLIEPGQVVAAGQTSIRVARFAEKEAVVAIPETLVGVLNRAPPAALFGPSRKYAAKLREIAPQRVPLCVTGALDGGKAVAETPVPLAPGPAASASTDRFPCSPGNPYQSRADRQNSTMETKTS
jgi:multidrug efflux pump subunit AcrA (membrane-fusion protein)